MGYDTKIAWASHTFNGWIGCTKVSPACENCYAEDMMDNRYGRVKWGKGNPRSKTSKANWKKPLRWSKEAEKLGIRYRVFCSSLSDVFDAEVEDGWREEIFALIRETPNLDWLLLTKRPENIKKMLPKDWDKGYNNVWLGTSAENQKMTDLRIPILSEIPAKVRFVSAEPLLGPIKLPEEHNIHWYIIGGESGNFAREMDMDWVMDLRKQCKDRNVAFFFKQTGSFYATKNKLKHRKGEDSSEWPGEINSQEFPPGTFYEIEV